MQVEDIRFITELRYEDKPYLTMMAGLPFSAKNNDAFDGMQGSFFSPETAPEVILQKSFAAQLLERCREPAARTSASPNWQSLCLASS